MDNSSGLSKQTWEQENPEEKLNPKRTRSKNSELTLVRYEMGEEIARTRAYVLLRQYSYREALNLN